MECTSDITAQFTEANGRKIVQMMAINLVWTEIEQNIIELKDKHGAQEIHLIGLTAVYVDGDLNKSMWHGTNVLIVTGNVFIVGSRICWDVSGLDGQQHKSSAANNGEEPGECGRDGKHGLPGESGGNIHILCNQLVNGECWTIRSEGGRGSNGQDGGNGVDGKHGKDAKKMTRTEFDKQFPTLALWSGSEAGIARATILKTMDQLVPKPDRSSEKTGKGRLKYAFFIEGPSKDGTRITLSFYCNTVTSRRHMLVLVKGAKGEIGEKGGKGGRGGQGGDGGYHGTVVVENFERERTDLLINLSLINYENGRAESGKDGKNGIDGQHGKDGKSAGDLGFIDKVAFLWNWLYKPTYYGFDSDSIFEIEYYDTKPDEAYVRCDVKGKRCWAKIKAVSSPPLSNQQERQHQKSERNRESQMKMEAVRKKTVDRSSLIYHANQVVKYNDLRY